MQWTVGKEKGGQRERKFVEGEWMGVADKPVWSELTGSIFIKGQSSPFKITICWSVCLRVDGILVQ